MTERSEDRLYRIERSLELYIEESRRDGREMAGWMKPLSKAVVELTNLQVLDYTGPREPVTVRRQVGIGQPRS